MLLEGRELDAGELCRDAGVENRPVMAHHLGRLRAVGKIESRREGRRAVYRLTDAGRVILRAVELFANLDRPRRQAPWPGSAAARGLAALDPIPGR